MAPLTIGQVFGSNETPQEITDRYVDPPAGERTLVASEEGNFGTVFLVRNDGTAHTMIGLTFCPAFGWHLETFSA